MDTIKMLLEKANRLPLLPGVYIMLDDKGEVIYVGKAKKLKNRVSSYFHGEHLPKVAAMVAKAADFQVIVAASEFEALVLENSLIKRHRPHYNILLKDDKGYPFIRMDRREEYPRMEICSRAGKDGADYFGPFGGRSQSREIIDAISKALLLPDCSRVFPRDIGKERPCLNYHLEKCAGWCLRDADAGDYRTRIEQAALILDGKSDELVAALQGEMTAAAEELRFERAAELRDRIRAIEGLQNRQRVIATAFTDTDAVGFCRGAKSCFTVLHFVEGDLIGKDVEMLDEPLESDGEAVEDLVRQYYTGAGAAIPKTVLLPCELDGAEELERLIGELSGRRVHLEVPKRGERMRLVESAQLNAKEEIERRTTGEQRRLKTLEWLQRALELEELPRRIEAFDISNLGNQGIVAAMTVFQDGKPLRRDYRKFRIRDLEQQDDYASMHQAVTRRFQHYLDGDEKFAPLPDLLLIQLLRHGEGRPAPHARPGHGGRPRDRHQRQPGGLFADRQHPGGNPPQRHHLPAKAARRGHGITAGRDRGDRAEAQERAAEAFPLAEGYQHRGRGCASGGASRTGRESGPSLFPRRGGTAVRVITGSAGGRKLKSPAGDAVRPTADQVKQAVFNIIQFDLEGRRVLDLFGGTGQLGIEALSRGAREAVFVDSDRSSAALIRENLKTCGMKAEVVQSDALSYRPALRRGALRPGAGADKCR